jgi:hypothetical protein
MPLYSTVVYILNVLTAATQCADDELSKHYQTMLHNSTIATAGYNCTAALYAAGEVMQPCACILDTLQALSAAAAAVI